MKHSVRQVRAVTFALWALLAGASTLANRPLVSETADVNADGHCNVESALWRVSARDTAITRLWDSSISCGIGHDSQFSAGHGRERSEGQTALSYSVGGKTTLVLPQPGRAIWGVAWQFGAVQAQGQSLRLDEIKVVGLATRELAGGVLGHANLGWSHSRSDRKNRTVWSLGLETSSDLVLTADIFGDDRGRPSIAAGVGHTLGGGFSVNLGYALQFDRPRLRSLSLGAQLEF